MSHNDYQGVPQHYSGGGGGGDNYSTQEIRNQSYSSVTDGGYAQGQGQGQGQGQAYEVRGARQEIVVDELPAPMNSSVRIMSGLYSSNI